jgi:ATP-binding cassette, subfamily B, bacterial PglK
MLFGMVCAISTMKEKVKEKIKRSILTRSILILPASDRPKILIVIFLQISLALLDLIGIAIIGILGALSVSGIESTTPNHLVSKILNFLNLESHTFQRQVIVLACLSMAILISRTFFSIVITRRILFFLSRRGATMSGNLVSKLLSLSLLRIKSRSTQETIYALTIGTTAITLGILGTAVTILADGVLLVIIAVGLLLIDTVIALSAVIFFGSLGLILYRLMYAKANRLGTDNAKLSIKSNEKLVEVLGSYRELFVSNRRSFYGNEIRELRTDLADILAEIQFMPNVSKYVIEAGIVIGAVIIAGIQFRLHNAQTAVSTLALFLAASTRLAPAIMRLQQNVIQMRSSASAAIPTLSLIDELRDVEFIIETDDSADLDHDGFNGKIEIDSVTFTYPDKDMPTLKDISINVSSGSSIALVGPSGAGKTTIVDVLLGILTPDSGSVTISGHSPMEAILNWPGAIAYVPQDVKIVNGSIREYIGMGYSSAFASDEMVWGALETALLAKFVRELPFGLDSNVGEGGANLSGGQRQRLGIARAMFTKPKLLILDEATSSLDGETEFEVTEAIKSLAGKVTVVLIAHRLSTVRNSNQVIYMENGEILARGTFDEVRSQVPNFDRQAKLMGL